MESEQVDESNPQHLEDVSVINLMSDEQIKELSQGAEVKTGSLRATFRAVGGDIWGEVSYKYWWGNNGGVFYCYSTSYRITSTLPGSATGNKANMHFSFDSLQWWGNDSPDNLRQDDKDYPYAVGGWVGANGRARVYVEFTFDFSMAPDPKRNNQVWINF